MKFTDKELQNIRLKVDATSKTIFYDGECALCNGSIRFIKRYDSKNVFNYVPFQFSQKENEENTVLSTVIFVDNEKIYKESDAILHIVRYLKSPVSWLYMFKLIPRFVRDWIYRIISTNRHKLFGRSEVCRF